MKKLLIIATFLLFIASVSLAVQPEDILKITCDKDPVLLNNEDNWFFNLTFEIKNVGIKVVELQRILNRFDGQKFPRVQTAEEFIKFFGTTYLEPNKIYIQRFGQRKQPISHIDYILKGIDDHQNNVEITCRVNLSQEYEKAPAPEIPKPENVELAKEIHNNAWLKVAKEAAINKAYKYAIYQSRSLAVKHPELYLQGDALFNKLLTGQPSMWEYYILETQNFNERQAKIVELRKKPGKSFKWSKFDIKKHRSIDYQKIYDTPAFLPFLDLRLYFLGASIKGTNWQAPPLSMAEFLYFQAKANKSFKDLFLLVGENGSAYLAGISRKKLQLIRYDGTVVERPSEKIVLIFNEQYVWYPLMDRDDTKKSKNLTRLVQEYTTPDNLPQLTNVEKEIVNYLKETTALKDKTDIDISLIFTGKLHFDVWRHYPEQFQVLYPKEVQILGFNRSDGPGILLAQNTYISRVSNWLSPATAKHASIARENASNSLDTMMKAVFNRYLDYVETRKQPRFGFYRIMV